MKIAAGMIIFSSDFILKEVLDSIYPYMNQILISEGPVKYWQEQGYKTSYDLTNEILKNYPDPENKITVIHGQYDEKTEQANAYMKHVEPDTDYVWNIDADEVFKPKDIELIITLLETRKPTSVGFKSFTFFGGFTHYLTGFEQEHEFIRIQKYTDGAVWENHRPPTIALPEGAKKNHLSYKELADMGVYMYHYSYVNPAQVYDKIAYYEDSVIKKGNCIPNYIQEVYLPWMLGGIQKRKSIEHKNQGVHEFIPTVRGECYTAEYKGRHPEVIVKIKEKRSKEIELAAHELFSVMNTGSM